MTPLVSWVIISCAAVFAVIVAIAVHVALQEWDCREWERSVQDWKSMCSELDLEPYDWSEHDD